jgi:hypothetical protein
LNTANSKKREPSRRAVERTTAKQGHSQLKKNTIELKKKHPPGRESPTIHSNEEVENTRS